jgi:DNA-binding NarL/FixJ family response regulator
MTVRVLLVEDHQVVRKGLRLLLDAIADVEVVAAVGDGRSAVRAAQEHRPDLVLMDVGLPDISGIEATRRIIEDGPRIRVIAVSMYSDRHIVEAMLAAGAQGYLLKDCVFGELGAAIRAVMSGQRNVGLSLVVPTITERETDVLVQIANGAGRRTIAERLGISVKTVDVHRANLMEKLDLGNTAKLTRHALREGIVGDDEAEPAPPLARPR